ncbi:MAG: DUF3494 domain-containing protein [Acidobacteriota bacterium]|nr:DUF3494 domain-containing protein [Acidobacteriota bacterium]
MSTNPRSFFGTHLRARPLVAFASASSLLGAAIFFSAFSSAASAATSTVNLGSSSTFAILAGSTITNTGSSVISGNIGLSPGTSITGFPPGIESTGTTSVANPTAVQAQTDLVTAYNDAAGRTPATTEPSELGGLTLAAGVYTVASSATLTGTLTLNGANDATSTFIIQIPAGLTTASASSIVLENGAQACNVFWQVTSSATLGTGSSFAGTLMALSSITATTGAKVSGRLLARNGAVTLDTNSVTVPTCAAVTPTTTTTLPTTTTTLPTTTTTSPTTTTTAPVSTTTTPIIPVGAPQTGFGGTAGGASNTPALVGFAALAALLGTGLAGYGVRRRRIASSGSPDEPREG